MEQLNILLTLTKEELRLLYESITRNIYHYNETYIKLNNGKAMHITFKPEDCLTYIETLERISEKLIQSENDYYIDTH